MIFNAERYFRERRLRCKQTEPRRLLEQILVCKFFSETFCFAFVLLQAHHQVKKLYCAPKFAQPLTKYLTQHTARISLNVKSILFLCNNRIEKITGLVSTWHLANYKLKCQCLPEMQSLQLHYLVKQTNAEYLAKCSKNENIAHRSNRNMTVKNIAPNWMTQIQKL